MSHVRSCAHIFRPRLALLAALALIATVTIAPARAAAPPAAPAGLTAIALDGKVSLAWQASADATSYQVYRGTSQGAITDLLTPAGVSGTSFQDTTAVDGTTYYYTVKATSADGQSTADQIAQALPRARSCTTGNAVVVENCFPGSTGWKATGATREYPTGIEGFLSASSVDAGGSVDLRVSTNWNTPYHVEIYRTGYYGGSQGRLISMIRGRTGKPTLCNRAMDTTGLVDCSAWPVGATISTGPDWVSGAYTVKIVRDDNGEYSETVLVVRHDGNHSELLYHVPTSTFQAYNNNGEKSLYSYASGAPNTMTGATRAMEVDFDRPYAQPPSGAAAHDWYTRTDVATVSWLEQQGYDISYIASEDLNSAGGQLTDHKVVLFGSHDEYWSQQMYDAAVAARNAGTSLIFLGANTAYWKVRFAPSPSTGRPNRLMIGYKTIESGPADPVTPTTTWRDPSGPNRPENQLVGQMYIGDNASADFPLRVSASEGRNRMWRHTSLNSLAAGTTASVGTAIVGWEWDARADNGLEPAGVQTVASSPVTGNLVQNNGAAYTFGNATQNSTIYKAASGAWVFSTGTNNWWRGLATNVHGAGEPDGRIRQAMVNVLSDMGAQPATPASGLEVDAAGAPVLGSTTPADGATGVALGASVRATFDRELDPGTVGDGDLTITDPDGNAVAGSVSLDSAGKTVVFAPSGPLEPAVVYTAHLGTGVKSWHGDSPSAGSTWHFTTGPGAPPTVVTQMPASGATGVFTDASVTARFDRALNPATVTTSTFSVRPTAGGNPVAATVSYDSATRTARLTPSVRLAQSTGYTATVTTGVQATDGIAMAADSSWTFTTGADLQITGTFPASGATGVSPAAALRATFSRAVDASTIGAGGFTVSGPAGSVPGAVTYDPVTRTATFTPATGLSPSSSYSVTVGSGVRAADGAPANAATWTFATAASAPPAPATTALAPADGAASVADAAAITATFDTALDAATVTTQTFTLTPDGGSPVAASVSYDVATRRVTLTPLAGLDAGAHYTATLSTAIRSAAGAPLAGAISWSFTVADCPCSLMSGMTPATTGLPVQDYRPGTGPFTYELGTKISVTQTAQLLALRFWKEPGETGTHIGRVWNSSGQQLAQVTYQNEKASGWQRQALTAPLTLQPGQTYVVSVGLNSFYAKTVGGLATQMSSGPLRSVADGANGVYNGTAGNFPSSNWQSSNYFVDAVVKLPSHAAKTPSVTAQSPASGATGVSPDTAVRATFDVTMDASTVNDQTFTLADSGGNAVAGSVGYDESTRTATFTPSSSLHSGTAYTARLSTGVRSDDETPLAAPVAWSFATVGPAPPAVTSASPVDGASLISPDGAVTATFDQAMKASTITSSSFTLSAPSGDVTAAVAYDSATRRATLTPSAPLSASTTYVARLSTAVQSAGDVALAAAYSWSFTTSPCPCKLFADSAGPTASQINLDTANGRTGAGPYSLEMGLKIRVSQPAKLRSIRYWRAPGETGSHSGRIWTADGTPIASVSFGGETSSGWQTQDLPTAVDLTPGQSYVVSVGMNSRFSMTAGVFAGGLSNGPLATVVDGRNGVFADAAGTFPSQSWGNSNYWIDAVIR